jgi:tryptophan synthase alpha chain
MTSVSQAFKNSRMQNRKALVPYLTAGFPDQRLFVRLLREFVKMGADLLEIGIPFSDPLADGRSIQYSSQKALENGINVDKTFELLGTLDQGHKTPLILMSYYNPILSYGASRFARNAKKVGVAGLIIPDMIPEEGKTVEQVCRGNGLDLIYLLAPTSSSRRRKNIIKRSRGFVYLVSVTGVTGQRKELPAYLNSWIRQVKEESPLPVCVGFGISNGQQARSISKVADGVIVGSAIIEIVKKGKTSGQIIERTKKFMRSIREGMDSD